MKILINRSPKLILSALVLQVFAGCAFWDSLTSNRRWSSSVNTLISETKNVPIAKNFKITTQLEGLQRPWSMAWLPDGSILITERPGRLRIVSQGILQPNPISGVPEVLAVGQGGLLDVSVHPNFAQNNWIYLTYAHGQKSANRTRVARATFDGSGLQDLKVIFEVGQTKTDTQHFGSRIVWLPDKTMLIAFGDGGNPPVKLDGELIRKQAQNLNSYLGKVVRIKDDGSIPTDNPWAEEQNVDPAIWSYGHRNIQGLAFDKGQNRLWSTEHGARGGDELNLVIAGENYGWPEVTYSREYFGGEISGERSRPGLQDPKLVWRKAIAPSGLAFYNSDHIGQWQGDLFAGGLVSQDVRYLDLDDQGNILKEESLPIGQRVRDVKQGPDGKLYVLTDESNGQLLTIEPTES